MEPRFLSRLFGPLFFSVQDRGDVMTSIEPQAYYKTRHRGHWCYTHIRAYNYYYCKYNNGEPIIFTQGRFTPFFVSCYMYKNYPSRWHAAIWLVYLGLVYTQRVNVAVGGPCFSACSLQAENFNVFTASRFIIL